MDKDKFNEIIERSKQGSKEDFLRFVTGIYGIDEHIFEHIWDVPVIAPSEGDTLVTTSLSTKTEDELLGIVNKFISEELGQEDGCFISLDKIAVKFTAEELEEWKKKLDNGEANINYNAIIVYNETELQKKYNELIKANSANKKTRTEIDKIFYNYVKGVITHERCHLNANCLVTEIRPHEVISEEINGAEISSLEQDDYFMKKENNRGNLKDYSNRNEVLIDTLSQIMNNYQEGDTIEDCLYRIIEKRKGKSQYMHLDDREVLTMYTLFPDELTRWATFGAYDFIRENKLQKMLFDVCGTDMLLQPCQFNKKVEEYVATLEEDILSEKQVKMLGMLGFSIRKKIYKDAIKEVAISERALGAFAGSLLDVKAFIQSVKENDVGREDKDGE